MISLKKKEGKIMNKLTKSEINMFHKINNVVNLIQSMSVEEWIKHKKIILENRKKEIKKSSNSKKIKIINKKQSFVF